MTDRPEDDDDALSWAGDRDTTHADSRLEPEPDIVDEWPAEDDPARMSSFALITYGVLAGVYLLFTLGWITSVVRTTLPVVDLLAGIMYQLGQFLAIASPALWFAAALLLTRGRKPVIRLLWMVLGLVVVAPWPFLLGR